MSGMSKILELRPSAEKDLEAIFEYTFDTWGWVQAESYQTLLFRAFSQLLDNPKLGSLSEHNERQYRRWKSGKHVIFYRETSTGIAVIRVLHERMIPKGMNEW